MTFSPYPSAPPPPEQPPPDPIIAPRALRAVVTLLILNLSLSIALTIAVLIARHSVIDYQLDHRHITDPSQRDLLRRTYADSLWVRVAANVVVSVVYLFLVRALLRGRRWAYRRVIWIGIAGSLALVLVQLSPYPLWMRGEQVLQAVVLLSLVYLRDAAAGPQPFRCGPAGPRRPPFPSLLARESSLRASLTARRSPPSPGERSATRCRAAARRTCRTWGRPSPGSSRWSGPGRGRARG